MDEPLTPQVLKRHFAGEVTVGAYQLDMHNCVKWLCFDLDPEKLSDARETAQKLLDVMLEKEVERDGVRRPRIWPEAVLLEASRYPDFSYHIWIFFSLPVPAKVAQWLGYRIVELASINPKRVEVFPKQTELQKERPYGNFVKLPLGKHQVSDKWSRLLDPKTFEPLPNDALFEKFGICFSDADIAKISSFESKKDVQMALPAELPVNVKTLTRREEEKIARWLAKHWVEGYRNQLEMFFLGLCLKRGVSRESARRIISAVANLKNDEEKTARLALVDYHYRGRTNIRLKGKAGIRELLGELKHEPRRRIGKS